MNDNDKFLNFFKYYDLATSYAAFIVNNIMDIKIRCDMNREYIDKNKHNSYKNFFKNDRQEEIRNYLKQLDDIKNKSRF